MEIIAAVVVSFIAVFALKPFAEHFQLVDKPDERKHHSGSIPLIGGLAFFFATLVGCLIAFPDSNFVSLYLISSGLIVTLGTMDDYHDLSVKLRLVAQLLIASILIFGAGQYIHKFGAMFGFGNADIGIFGTLLTVFGVIGAINAFNMTDGIDGLAGSLALNTFASIAILLAMAGQHEFIELPVILVCVLIPYLLFNLGFVPGPVKKIFMGDAGSMFIGLTVIWLLTLGTQSETPAFRTVTALWIIAIPLMDMAAIIVRRVRKGQSAFQADRDHLHHIFMRGGFSPRQSLLVIIFFSMISSGIGIAGEYYQVHEAIMFYGFLVAFGFYSWGLQHCWRLVRWANGMRAAN